MRKFESYKKWINEKFTEKSDPVKDMGIGLFIVRDYVYAYDAAKFIVANLTAIIGTEEIPDDVYYTQPSKSEKSSDNARVFNGKYFPILRKFMVLYVKHNGTIGNMNFLSNVLREIFDILEKMGYPKKTVNEKFTEGGDPIKDMKIGIFIKRHYDKVNVAAKRMFQFLPEIIGVNEIPDDVVYPLGHQYAFNEKYLKSITDYIHAYVDNDTKFKGDLLTALYTILHIEGYPKKRKKIEEKFSEESNPIDDLTIGIRHEILKFVEKEGYNYPDNENMLWICALYGKINFVKYLLEKGVDPNSHLGSALSYSSLNGHDKIVKILLDAGADVNINNGTPLRYASTRGQAETIKILLDAGADVHAKNDESLRVASEHGYYEIVKILLDAGADVHAKNDEALQYAIKNDDPRLIRVIEDHIKKEKENFNK